MSRNYTNLGKDSSSIDNRSIDQIKTTDVNILLNRVRLDKKKTFKKNIIISLLLVGLICSVAISLII